MRAKALHGKQRLSSRYASRKKYWSYVVHWQPEKGLAAGFASHIFTKPNLGPFLLGEVGFPLQNQHHIFFFSMGPRFLGALGGFYRCSMVRFLHGMKKISDTHLLWERPKNWTFHLKKKLMEEILGELPSWMDDLPTLAGFWYHQSISNTVLVFGKLLPRWEWEAVDIFSDMSSQGLGAVLRILSKRLLTVF